MTDRRNLYLRAAEGDEEAERALLAHLKRKVAQREVDRMCARAGDRMLSLDACGELVLRAAQGDRWARRRVVETLIECDGPRVATGRLGPSLPDGLAGPSARVDIRAMGLQIAMAAVPIDHWSMVPPLRFVVFEDD
jgi:hypothetical protein